MDEQSQACSNCYYSPVSVGAICPNCGAWVGINVSVPPIPQSTENFITGNRWADWWLGFLLNWGLIILYGIGILLNPIIYFAFCQKQPTFTRGFGIGMLSVPIILIVAIMLLWGITTLYVGGDWGAFAICMYSFSR